MHRRVLLHLLERIVVGPIHMGRSRNTGNLAVTAHGNIAIYLDLDLQPNVIIWWSCGKIFFDCNILEGLICAMCRCVVVTHMVLYWQRRFCCSMEWAAI